MQAAQTAANRDGYSDAGNWRFTVLGAEGGSVVGLAVVFWKGLSSSSNSAFTRRLPGNNLRLGDDASEMRWLDEGVLDSGTGEGAGSRWP